MAKAKDYGLNYAKATAADIVNFIKENHPEDKQWLMDTLKANNNNHRKLKAAVWARYFGTGKAEKGAYAALLEDWD